MPGDSFNWSWVRGLEQVKYLAIHHSASPDTQTPLEIANYHISSNGWGGIGYHFLIDKGGTVYYVGDISTARANVANLNEQVIGICLIGNFTGIEPSPEQINSAKILCDFFINNYPDLSNLTSWEVVKGHKELPGQSTACPGNTWLNWKPKIISSGGGSPVSGGGSTPVPTNLSGSLDRGGEITELYRKVLGRDPDMGGLQTYINGPLSIGQIMESMVYSEEHRNLLALANESKTLVGQVENLQTSLGLVNEQLINLQQKLQEKDQETINLKAQLGTNPSSNGALKVELPTHPSNGGKKDTTLTIFQALFNLYKFVFMPGKVG